MKKTDKLFWPIIILLVIAIAFIILYRPWKSDTAGLPAPLEPETRLNSEPSIIIKEKLVEVEKSISAETIEGGIRDMGFLITGEYYFTEVVSYSSVKKLLGTEMKLPFTESGYLASYDGKVEAGVDLSQISVTKDDANKRILIPLPQAAINTVDIDPNSFQLYSEKSGWGNPISIADYNASLIELENVAREKAADNGLLQRADDNAKALIGRLVVGMLNDPEYSVEFTTE